ncbi:hypothetical protein [Synechococcus sp. PCC 6312]|uniref:hypothetical protein n=1 Tax=Synechococcus sp. (strain ATCC 27167 / PCC 6312) TaxID=195253 RepID=UPI00029F43B7|nr:hypothetical protein [Synechococcus sp. PCC 6312]AFY60931.1 hypothetical protein Syn6312_1786 [Synechococcus sp. PCC 6312]
MVAPTSPSPYLPLAAKIELHHQQIIVAQQFKDTLGSDFAKSWNNFVDSGQVWALMIGLALGWIAGKLLNF